MKSAPDEGGRDPRGWGTTAPHRRSQLNLGNEEGRGEKELSSESGDWEREERRHPSNATASSLQRSYINLGEIPKRKERGRGKGDGGKKLKSGMEAKAIALRKASEGNNIAGEGVTLETSTPL